MANDEMQNEIEALRAQLIELTTERKAGENKQESSSHKSEKESVMQGTAPSESGTDEAKATKSEVTGLSSQFQELIDTINKELKDTSPITVLVVFAVGIIVGRLLPR